jgi:hypothetical protein
VETAARLRTRRARRRRGTTLIEILIAVTLFTVVMLSSLAMIEADRRLSMATLEITTVEDLAQQMLFRLEHELAAASGAEPNAVLTAHFGIGQEGVLVVDSTLGFPPSGWLLVDREKEGAERVRYSQLDADQVTFVGIARGEQCTPVGNHPTGGSVMWVGLAEPIDLQENPPEEDWDGVALESGAPLWFRGDGTGFSYRIPVDPTGGTSYLNGDELRFGAEIRGVGPIESGWAALWFEPETAYDESVDGIDINGDGDEVDVFDIGQVRRTVWDVTDPSVREEIGLGPSRVVQERCNWGGDLDGDGFDDPLFLWNKDTNELHVRIFVLGNAKRRPIVRKVESLLFLRNEPEL